MFMIKEEKKVTSITCFPKIMKNSVGTIVLFDIPGKGIYLNSALIGKYFSNIMMEGFEDYNEPVTLQNSQ